MDRNTQLYWRYGWLLLGLLGLIALTFLSGRGATPTATQDSAAWIEALWRADAAAIDRALDAGADPTAELDAVGSRPLHVVVGGDACRLGTGQVARSIDRLVMAGASVNETDQAGNTPLTLAARRCPRAVLATLLRHGAQPEAVNARGLTALEITLTRGDDAIDALLESGERLAPERAAEFRRIYADEPSILATIERAATRP